MQKYFQSLSKYLSSVGTVSANPFLFLVSTTTDPAIDLLSKGSPGNNCQ